MGYADIAVIQGSGQNRCMITQNTNWVVPMGVHNIWITACAAGEDGSASDPNYIAKAGDFVIDKHLRVMPGQRINVLVGTGNTQVVDFITLIAGSISGEWPNTKLGKQYGYRGNPGMQGQKGQEIASRSYFSQGAAKSEGGIGGQGGYGGAFGLGGNGAGGGGGGGAGGNAGTIALGDISSSQRGFKYWAPDHGSNGGNGGPTANTELLSSQLGDMDRMNTLNYYSMVGDAGVNQILSPNSRTIIPAQFINSSEAYITTKETIKTRVEAVSKNMGEVGNLGETILSGTVAISSNVTKDVNSCLTPNGGNGGRGGKGAAATQAIGYGSGGGSCGSNGKNGNSSSVSSIEVIYKAGQNGTGGQGGQGGDPSKGAPGMVLIEW